MSDVVVVEVERLAVPYPVPVASNIGGHVILFGYSLKESTGATGAEVDIFSGTSNTGLLALPIALDAGQSTEDWFGPNGVRLEGGLFSQVTIGAVVGSLFVHLRHDPRRD